MKTRDVRLLLHSSVFLHEWSEKHTAALCDITQGQFHREDFAPWSDNCLNTKRPTGQIWPTGFIQAKNC